MAGHVGYMRKDRSVVSSYVHYGEKIRQLGSILLACYNTDDLARELVSLGAMSWVGPRIKPNKGERHSFDKPVADVTVAYKRDRREVLRFKTSTSIANHLETVCEDFKYVYLWIEDQWYVAINGEGFIPLQVIRGCAWIVG